MKPLDLQCTKITLINFGDKQLYRSFDNRLRYTERRPDLYESDSDIFGASTTVLDISDTPTKHGADVLLFGQKHHEARTPDWLWDYQGRLKILATKFHKGVHYAARPEHFLPIVAHLNELHRGGFVHGDIRAFNMVLHYEDSNKPSGKLIDFDYGGKVTMDDTQDAGNGYLNPKYPSGYVHHLEDGLRLGRPDEAITISHDWYALGFIIFDLYDLDHPKIAYEYLMTETDQPLTDEQKLLRDQRSRLIDLRAY